jgi:hypothetical protein
MMAKLPEFRVLHDGRVVKKVEWDPCDGKPAFDITDMHVVRVERDVRPDGSVPTVKVTFAARLVELE